MVNPLFILSYVCLTGKKWCNTLCIRCLVVNLGGVCSSKSSKSLCSDLFDDGAVADDDDCIGISSEDEESLVSSFNDGILDAEWGVVSIVVVVSVLPCWWWCCWSTNDVPSSDTNGSRILSLSLLNDFLFVSSLDDDDSFCIRLLS